MKKKIISVILTFAVIGMLLISGGANAFELNLKISDSNVEQGQTIILTPTIQVTSDDSSLPITEIILIIQNTEGTPKKVCRFDVNGNKISECDGVLDIRLVESTSQRYGYGYGHYLGARRDYGYGYGYTQGNLTYEVVLDTTNLPQGTYSTTFQVKIKDDLFEKSGGNFVVSQSILTDDVSSDSGSEVIRQQKSYTDEQKLDITRNGEYEFKYGDEEYTLNVNDIDPDSISLTVHSPTKNINLNNNNAALVDLDNKNYNINDLESTPYKTNDMEMRILYLSEDGSDATIALKALNNTLQIEQMPYVEVTEIAPVTDKIDSQKQLEEKKKTSWFNEFNKTPLNWVIFLVVINLIILILIIILKSRR